MSLLAWEAALPAARPCQPHRPGSPGQRSANAAGDAACSSHSSGMPSRWPPSRSAAGHLLLVTLWATAQAGIGVPP